MNGRIDGRGSVRDGRYDDRPFGRDPVGDWGPATQRYDRIVAEPEAAVAIVHVRGALESVLLIRRAEREGDPWSGHWSFPGGRREPEDRDLIETALRELAEECGIRLGRECLEESLPPSLTGRRLERALLVAPFLFRADCEMATVLDTREAVEALWIPLSVLRDPARHCLRAVPRFPREMAFPSIELNGVPLWGFTYRVIAQWLKLYPDPQPAGFEAACGLLTFLLDRCGLRLRRGWSACDGKRVEVAQVQGIIPVTAVLDHCARPGSRIPPVSVLEVRADSIRMVGLGLEEYRIEASGGSA